MSRATNTHSEYVILIDFPLEQWLQELASVLRYTFILCLVLLNYDTTELRDLKVVLFYSLLHFMIELRDSDILSYYLMHGVIT